MLSIGLICYQLYSPHTTALRLRIHSAAEHARKVIPQPEGPLCDLSHCRPHLFPPISTNRDAARRKEKARSLADDSCASDTPIRPVADHS